MIGRAIWTIVALVIYWAANTLYSPIAALQTAQVATHQFENSDSAFVNSYLGVQFWGGVYTLFSLLVLLALVVIWWMLARNLIKQAKQDMNALVALLAIGGAIAALYPQHAFAFATNGNDVKEFAAIEPDETAFMIPNFGANLDTQSQYRPEYLNSKDVKVPGKYINIPHSKLSGTGGDSGLSAMFGSDYWVNSATLIKVKRTQYSRVWVRQGRGTHKDADESFSCQTKDGLNVKYIGIAIIVYIEDQNAALYLSKFGLQPLNPQLDRSKIENIFISTRYARTLVDVTDDVGYTQVHNLVCKYIGNEDNPKAASGHMNQIMDSVTKELGAYLTGVGITLQSLGWADTWTFDDDVQFAMNQAFNASMVQPVLETLERNANINLKEGMSVGFRNKMPSTLFFGSPELLGVAASGAAARTTGATAQPPAR